MVSSLPASIARHATSLLNACKDIKLEVNDRSGPVGMLFKARFFELVLWDSTLIRSLVGDEFSASI